MHRWSDASEIENSRVSFSTHGFGLAQTLALGRQLAMLPHQLSILGIEIDPAASGDHFSEPIRRKLPFLVRQAMEEILARISHHRS